MSSFIKYLFIGTSCVLLSHCAQPAPYPMRGIIQNQQGTSEGTVQLQVIDNYSSYAPQIMAILPDGERFDGKLIYERTITEDNIYRYDQRRIQHNSTSYGSIAQAMLISNQGHTMNCTFQLANPPTGIRSGGFGECKVSDGRTIPVQF